MLLKTKIKIETAPADISTIGTLVTCFKEGKIVILPKWLQRLLRKSKWEASRWQNIREYNDAFFNGESNLQPFYLAPIDVLLSQIEEDMEYITGELSLKAYNEIVTELKNKLKNGALFVLLDGQNRLVVSLCPFFESRMGVEVEKELTVAALSKIFKENKKLSKRLNEGEDIDIYDNDTNIKYRRTNYGDTSVEAKISIVEWIDYTDYPNGFTFIDEKTKQEKTLNNFQFGKLSGDEQELFMTTPVDIKLVSRGKLSDIAQSLVNLNKNNSWSEIEHALIECVPLSYKINEMIFENPVSFSLFGNLKNIKGHMKDMSGAYTIEKKGHGKLLTELTYYSMLKGGSGFGNEITSCEILRNSKNDDDAIKVFDKRVKTFLSWLAESYDCLLPINHFLAEKDRPFTKELIRTLFMIVEIITNPKNNFHNKSPIKLPKGIKSFMLPKNFINDIMNFHYGKKNPDITPEDFVGKTPKEWTYASSTFSITSVAVNNRSDFINSFLQDNVDKWNNNNYFDTSARYSKKNNEEYVRQKGDGMDYWKGNTVSRRDTVEIEHLISTNGPNKGTDALENLVASTSKPNKLKSNKV